LAFFSGCQCIQQCEQWKCDNWGMCHFAPNKPGVYSPMVLPQSFGVPTSGLAPTSTPVYPTMGGVAPVANVAQPQFTSVPQPTFSQPMSAQPTFVQPTFAGPGTAAPTFAAPPTTAYPYAGQGQSMPSSSNCRDCQK
jgi:hypothetical protein